MSGRKPPAPPAAPGIRNINVCHVDGGPDMLRIGAVVRIAGVAKNVSPYDRVLAYEPGANGAQGRWLVQPEHGLGTRKARRRAARLQTRAEGSKA